MVVYALSSLKWVNRELIENVSRHCRKVSQRIGQSVSNRRIAIPMIPACCESAFTIAELPRASWYMAESKAALMRAASASL